MFQREKLKERSRVGLLLHEQVNEETKQSKHQFNISSSSSHSCSNSSVPFMTTSTNNINNTSIHLDHHHQHHQEQQQQTMSYSSMMQSSSLIGNFIGKDGAYDLGELDEALVLYLDGQQQQPQHQDHQTSCLQDQRQNLGMRPPTLNIFPSQPMHVEPPSSTTMSTRLVSPAPTGSKRTSEPSMDLADPPLSSAPEPSKHVKREWNRKGPTPGSDHEGPKTPDPKTLRRLAQNREAARKSRLRKKAYVQQLESCRIKLTQLEQELQRARSQGMFFGGDPAGVNNLSSVFDLEYSRWLEEHNRILSELRAAVQENLAEQDLRLFVDTYLAHYDELINLKAMVAKTDVFHLYSGMWKCPAERCFMWLGGFRPSELIKIIANQIEALTEAQIVGICGLQRSTQEAEEALSQGLESLNRSLSETIAFESLLNCPTNMNNYMTQMALGINKLSALEGFVRQADNLRQQTVHRLHQILRTDQAAKCFVAIAEYFHRLRSLSSLWLSRPRQD